MKKVIKMTNKGDIIVNDPTAFYDSWKELCKKNGISTDNPPDFIKRLLSRISKFS
jgi:hypothetical protein